MCSYYIVLGHGDNFISEERFSLRAEESRDTGTVSGWSGRRGGRGSLWWLRGDGGVIDGTGQTLKMRAVGSGGLVCPSRREGRTHVHLRADSWASCKR